MAVPRKQNRVLLTNSRKSGTFSLIYIYPRNNTITRPWFDILLDERGRSWNENAILGRSKRNPGRKLISNTTLASRYSLITISSWLHHDPPCMQFVLTIYAHMHTCIYISFYTLGGTLPYVAEALLCRILTTLLPLARRTRLWKSSHRTHVARNDGVWR